MANVIDAVKNVVTDPMFEIKKKYNPIRRVNGEGYALEEYIKDVFAGTLHTKDNKKRLKSISDTFSYLGNDNNPPDAILKNGDAIEVKKIESLTGTIQLNSSFPCQKLSSSSSMITNSCRSVDGGVWDKDLLYAIGTVQKGYLRRLFFIYGMDYAAQENVYVKIKNHIRQSITDIGTSVISKTNELGRINEVDPLGYTSLRVRGMWLIANPWIAFNYLEEVASIDDKQKFNFCAILNDEKIEGFENYSLINDLANIENVNVSNVEIKDPDNPANLRLAKLIRFSI